MIEQKCIIADCPNPVVEEIIVSMRKTGNNERHVIWDEMLPHCRVHEKVVLSAVRGVLDALPKQKVESKN